MKRQFAFAMRILGESSTDDGVRARRRAAKRRPSARIVSYVQCLTAIFGKSHGFITFWLEDLSFIFMTSQNNET